MSVLLCDPDTGYTYTGTFPPMKEHDMAEKKSKSDQQSTVQANKAPDAQQPGVTEANQDWETYRAETPEAQDQPSAFNRPEYEEQALEANAEAVKAATHEPGA